MCLSKRRGGSNNAPLRGATSEYNWPDADNRSKFPSAFVEA